MASDKRIGYVGAMPVDAHVDRQGGRWRGPSRLFLAPFQGRETISAPQARAALNSRYARESNLGDGGSVPTTEEGEAGMSRITCFRATSTRPSACAAHPRAGHHAT